jgi:hypothetical protein
MPQKVPLTRCSQKYLVLHGVFWYSGFMGSFHIVMRVIEKHFTQK